MDHEPLRAALRSSIHPVGRKARCARYLQGSKMWLCVQSPSWQGGLAALRCILPQGAHRVLFSGSRRMNGRCPSLLEVTHGR